MKNPNAKTAPSPRAQEKAFRNAELSISTMQTGEVLDFASSLLVSKGGPRLGKKLWDELFRLTEELPMDVVAYTSLMFAHRQFAGLLAFVDLSMTDRKERKSSKALIDGRKPARMNRHRAGGTSSVPGSVAGGAR